MDKELREIKTKILSEQISITAGLYDAYQLGEKSKQELRYDYEAAVLRIDELERQLAQFQTDGDGWVKCSDRLPEIGKYLVARPNEYSGNTDILIAKLHPANPKGQEYGRPPYQVTYSQFWSLPAIVDLDEITHWQPLPQPPSKPKE